MASSYQGWFGLSVAPLGHIWLLGDKKNLALMKFCVFDLVDNVSSICEAILKCVYV